MAAKSENNKATLFKVSNTFGSLISDQKTAFAKYFGANVNV